MLTPTCKYLARRGVFAVDRPCGLLAAALAPFGIAPDRIPVAFNCFMNVVVDGATGTLSVEPPLSRAGDRITFEAATDLVVGLTACSALQSNNGRFKPIHYRVDRPTTLEPSF